MFCSVCGQQNEADAKFCTNCGKKFLSAKTAPSSSAEQSSSAQPSAPSPTIAYVHTELKDSGTVTAMSVIGFVFGLIGMMGSFIPCIGSFAFYIGIPAALISAIALGIAYSQNAKKTFAIVAVTISLIGVVISGWQYFSIVSAGKNAERELKKMFNQEQQREERARQVQQKAQGVQARDLVSQKEQSEARITRVDNVVSIPNNLNDLIIGEVEDITRLGSGCGCEFRIRKDSQSGGPDKPIFVSVIEDNKRVNAMMNFNGRHVILGFIEGGFPANHISEGKESGDTTEKYMVGNASISIEHLESKPCSGKECEYTDREVEITISNNKSKRIIKAFGPCGC